MNNKVNYIKEVSNRVLHSAKFLANLGLKQEHPTL